MYPYLAVAPNRPSRSWVRQSPRAVDPRTDDGMRVNLIMESYRVASHRRIRAKSVSVRPMSGSTGCSKAVPSWWLRIHRRSATVVSSSAIRMGARRPTR